MLAGVNAGVAQRGVVERGHVPETEVDRPERQRDERVGERAEGAQRADREQRPQQPAVEAEHDEQRPEVAEQDVLEHVHREQPLLADRVDRRDERGQHDEDAGGEAERSAERDGAPAPPGTKGRRA